MVANPLFATTITSPTFTPKTGEISAIVDFGHTEFKYRSDGEKGKEYVAWDGHIQGMMGIKDYLLLNYGVGYGISKEIQNIDVSNDFTGFYFGFTGRYDNTFLKFNVGNTEIIGANYKINKMYGGLDNTLPYVELGIAQGLETKFYGALLSFTSIFYGEEGLGEHKYEKNTDLIFTLENEFYLGKNWTLGLDLLYAIIGNNKFNNYITVDNRDKYILNVDVNYLLNENNYMGLYFKAYEENSKYFDVKYRVHGYQYGLKLTTLFDVGKKTL